MGARPETSFPIVAVFVRSIVLVTEEAANALAIYNTVTDKAQRTIFLNSFESNGSGKGPNAFKWVYTFTKTLRHENTTEVAATEDMLNRPQILKHLGLSLADFSSRSEAFKFADAEVARNKEEYEHEGKPFKI